MRTGRRVLGAGLLALLLYGCGSATAPPQTQVTATEAPTATVLSAAATDTAQPLTTATAGSAPGAPATSPTPWVPPTALVGTPIEGAVATLTAAPPLKTGVVTFTSSKGEKINMTVEIADTEANRELGLMFRPSMPPDAGMLFVFDSDNQSGFWMENTILPLSIAFIKSDGTILNIEDMQPLDTNTTSAAGPYRYAIEANQGYFRAHEIGPGDKVTLPNQQSIVVPGMPVVGAP